MFGAAMALERREKKTRRVQRSVRMEVAPPSRMLPLVMQSGLPADSAIGGGLFQGRDRSCVTRSDRSSILARPERGHAP